MSAEASFGPLSSLDFSLLRQLFSSPLRAPGEIEIIISWQFFLAVHGHQCESRRFLFSLSRAGYFERWLAERKGRGPLSYFSQNGQKFLCHFFFCAQGTLLSPTNYFPLVATSI